MASLKEKITQLSREHFEYALPRLICSKEKIVIEVETGHTAKGVFILGNEEDRYMKGLLYSSSHLLRLSQSSFSGNEATIEYVFHAEDIRAKDSISGNISVVSSCGEMEIPFQINVVEKCVVSAYGEIHDLFNFTNIAKLDWNGAVSIFQSPDFKEIFLKKNVTYQGLYDGICQSACVDQAMEEFLIAIQKKEAAKIDIQEKKVAIQVRKEDAFGNIEIIKDNWGYLNIEISSSADFLHLEKENVRELDFIGNSCKIQYEIKNAKLRAGKNYGQVKIKTAYQEYVVEFLVEKCVKKMEHDYEESKIRKEEIILVNSYINFRSNRIDVAEYVTEIREALKKLEGLFAVKRNLGEMGYCRRLDLYQMHLYMVEGKIERAQELLNSLESEQEILRKNTLEDYCGYLYLKVLFHRNDEELQRVLLEIRQCYKQMPNSWGILWLLLFLDEKYEQEPKEKIAAITEQYDRGCRSPILYYEICNIIEHDPSLLNELTPCMIQALHMGVKQWFLSEAVAMQYAYLAERQKQYHVIIMRDLVSFYDKYKTKEVLTAICSILIQNHIADPSCFLWYKEGVKQKIRLTQLYEYYLYSVDEHYEGVFPQEIYMYFSYNANLLEEKKAFFYANIIKNKEYLTEVYALYEEQMRAYVFTQLEKGKMDQHMALLYHTFIQPGSVSATVAASLPNILFKHRIQCTNENITGVLVVHKECVESEYVNLDSEGVCYVDIYTEEPQIFLLDREGNRYTHSLPWTMEKLMKRTELAEACFRYVPTNRMICMFIYEKMEYFHRKGVSVGDLQKYMNPDWFREEYKKKWIMKLIQHYYDNYEGEALEALLLEVDLHGMRQFERNLITEYCIIRGLYDLAFAQIQEYSFEGVTVKRLRALCSKCIKKFGFEEENSILAKMTFYVFKCGKYDESMLQYLVRFYLGTTKNMFLVWKEAKEYDLDTTELEERLLGQILFAESYVQDAMSVFFSFYEKGSNRTLIKAFVSYYAYKYLVRDRLVDDRFFQIIEKELEVEENKTALYALLKYYSTLDSWNKEQTAFIEQHTRELIQKKIIFPFMQVFAKKMSLPGALQNRYFVEYKTDKNHKVVLHYFIEDEEMGEGFSALQMENVFEGVFVYSFTLFHNETLQYYIEETADHQPPIITESITVKGDTLFVEEDEDTYGQINTMLMAREMKDEKTLLTLLRNYEKNEYILAHAFKMLE